MICPSCLGYGQIDDCEADKSDFPDRRQFSTCVKCSGTGYVEDDDDERRAKEASEVRADSSAVR